MNCFESIGLRLRCLRFNMVEQQGKLTSVQTFWMLAMAQLLTNFGNLGELLHPVSISFSICNTERKLTMYSTLANGI